MCYTMHTSMFCRIKPSSSASSLRVQPITAARAAEHSARCRSIALCEHCICSLGICSLGLHAGFSNWVAFWPHHLKTQISSDFSPAHCTALFERHIYEYNVHIKVLYLTPFFGDQLTKSLKLHIKLVYEALNSLILIRCIRIVHSS